MFQEPSLYSVKAIAILDNDGVRMLSKVSSCSSFEYDTDTLTLIFSQTRTQIIMCLCGDYGNVLFMIIII